MQGRSNACMQNCLGVLVQYIPVGEKTLHDFNYTQTATPIIFVQDLNMGCW